MTGSVAMILRLISSKIDLDTCTCIKTHKRLECPLILILAWLNIDTIDTRCTVTWNLNKQITEDISYTSFAATVPWLNSSPAMNGLCVKLTLLPPDPPYEIVLMPSPMSKISNFVVTTVMLQSHCVTPLQLPMTFVMLQSGGVVSGV